MIIQHNSKTPFPLADKTVQTVITSPPYWGLRDYGVEGQLGMEETPGEYVEEMLKISREIKRVLRDDGVLWLNIGDSYFNTKASGPQGKTGDRVSRVFTATEAGKQHGKKCDGLKNKELCGIPWRVAFALQDDGWWLRTDVIWSKPNPMTESVKDRPTRAHEYVFMLTKQARYYYNADAIKEKSKYPDDRRKSNSERKRVPTKEISGVRNRDCVYPFRNARSVWQIPTQGFAGAHFATFPERLVERCMLAASREGDTVLDPFCGSGTVGVVAKKLGREFTGLELNPEYVKMGETRIANKHPQLDLMKDEV